MNTKLIDLMKNDKFKEAGTFLKYTKEQDDVIDALRTVDEQGNTFLHWAAKRSITKQIFLKAFTPELIKAIDFDKKNNDLETALEIAYKTKNANLINFILENQPGNRLENTSALIPLIFDQKEIKFDDDALMNAIKTSNFEEAKNIFNVSTQEQRQRFLAYQDNARNSVLHIICSRDMSNTDFLDTLADSVNNQHLTSQNIAGDGPLTLALKCDNPKVIAFILSKAENPVITVNALRQAIEVYPKYTHQLLNFLFRKNLSSSAVEALIGIFKEDLNPIKLMHALQSRDRNPNLPEFSYSVEHENPGNLFAYTIKHGKCSDTAKKIISQILEKNSKISTNFKIMSSAYSSACTLHRAAASVNGPEAALAAKRYQEIADHLLNKTKLYCPLEYILNTIEDEDEALRVLQDSLFYNPSIRNNSTFMQCAIDVFTQIHRPKILSYLKNEIWLLSSPDANIGVLLEKNIATSVTDELITSSPVSTPLIFMRRDPECLPEHELEAYLKRISAPSPVQNFAEGDQSFEEASIENHKKRKLNLFDSLGHPNEMNAFMEDNQAQIKSMMNKC